MSSKKKPVALYEVKITLLNAKPAIWRRVLVPADITLGDLHRVIQIAMGWDDDHLHEFEIGKVRYGATISDIFEVGDPSLDEDSVRLNGVVMPKAKFKYWYDFGDDWKHEIRIERELDSETGRRKARCIAGAGACPPEDCGGVYGYEEMLHILADPTHEEYGEMREWVRDDFDPDYFDLARTDRRLASLGF